MTLFLRTVIVWLRVANSTNPALRAWIDARLPGIVQMLGQGNRLVEVICAALSLSGFLHAGAKLAPLRATDSAALAARPAGTDEP